MQDYVGDGVIVEGSDGAREFQPPGADGPFAFEWKVARIAEAELKYATILIGAAGRDGGLRGDRQVTFRLSRVGEIRVPSCPAFGQRQDAADVGIGPTTQGIEMRADLMRRK